MNIFYIITAICFLIETNQQTNKNSPSVVRRNVFPPSNDVIPSFPTTEDNENEAIYTIFHSNYESQSKMNEKTILPGTNWCGIGQRSPDNETLGFFNETDACCREHDLCPQKIKSWETKYGLTNINIYTKSHCDCEQELYKCFKAANNPLAYILGETYFNILKPQCFNEVHPIVRCQRYKRWFLRKRCNEYEFDESKPIIWQWMDFPEFF